MGFLEPIAGFIAGSVGCLLVVLFWMLKLRRRPVRVSSTMLWQRSIRDLEGNIPWQRVRPSMLLLLQLIGVILLALAIARPYQDGAGWSRVSGEVMIIVDAGASMSAITDPSGESRLDIAKKDASDLVRTIGSRSSTSRFRVFRAGSSAQSMTSAPVSWRQARAVIRSIEPSDAASDLSASITLANLSASESEDSVDEETSDDSIVLYALTDALIDDSAVRVIRPGANQNQNRNRDWDAGNLGIVLVGAQRDVVDPEQCRVFVTVAGKVEGDDSIGVTIRARVDGVVRSSQSVALDPNEDGIAEAAATLAFPLTTAGIVELELSRPDVLMSDNSAWISMPDPTPITTTIVAKDNQADPLLVDVVRASTRGVVEVVSPDQPVPAATGFVVFDRVKRPSNLLLPTIEIGSDPSDGAQSESTRRVLGWDRGHPLMQDIDLGRLRYTIGADQRPEFGSDAQVVARDQDGPVIVETAQAGVRHLWIGFSIEDSNWGVQISMPIFFANAVQHLLPGTSGSGVVHRTGLDAERIGFTDESEEIAYSLLDRSQTLRAGPVTIADADNASRGGDEFAQGADGPGGRVELWRWLVLGGLIVLTLEWTLDLLRRRLH